MQVLLAALTKMDVFGIRGRGHWYARTDNFDELIGSMFPSRHWDESSKTPVNSW